MAFKAVSPNVNFPELEERVIKYWKENKIFEKSIESRSKEKTWTFLDGPPFITGLPHYGSLLSSIPKDLFPRFWTMKGYRVRRVWGWDCHGLPAENKVEEKLKIKRKKDIEEKIGVKKFIDECKKYVGDVSGEWEWYVDHIARWVDFKNAYKTMDLPYMETVMWVFKQMYEKGYIYKGLRVSLYCPHCSTPISNFEVAMDADNYKSISEPTAVYKYELIPKNNEPKTFLLAWSTTPWNKIATTALAVNPKLTYVKVLEGTSRFILAKATLKTLKGNYTLLEEFKGKDLVGKKFVPHYDYYPIEKGKKAFLVVPGDFVTADEGTGIVTIAAYGEEDLAVMQKENIHIEMHVDDEGLLKKNVPKWGGKYYLDVDPLVVDDLTKRNLIYRIDSYTHTVPICWRCSIRLIYAPQDAWYVDIQKLKPSMVKTNELVSWFPEHFKYGRFLKSMEAAPDWCISRSRYWGSPVPVWECTCGQRFVPGSIEELEKRSGKKIVDLHKPQIDEVTVTCEKCGKTVHRVPEVLDSWIEAGSASYAERHFPFAYLNNTEILRQAQGDPVFHKELDRFFPPDFIVEYTGQIRAWFYVLHVIATALFDSHAFKNVVVTGVILGTDGRKMSKNYGNYPDPKELLQTYGGDALRLYLMASPVMHGEDIRISEEQYRDSVRGTLLILWNVYNFFVTYANADKYTAQSTQRKVHSAKSTHVLDRWVLALLHRLVADVTEALENYDTVKAVTRIHAFISDVSTWYIRRSRDRVGPTAQDKVDKGAFYQTCHEVLMTLCKVMAPFTPFIAEEIYRNLTKEASVHLASWPQVPSEAIDGKLLSDMQFSVRTLVERVHAMRKKFHLKVRQPLARLVILGESEEMIKLYGAYESLIKDELNIKEIDYDRYDAIAAHEKNRASIGSGFFLDILLTPELQDEGEARELIRQIQILRKEKGCALNQRITVKLPASLKRLPKKFLSELRRQTLASDIVWSDSLSILTG